MIDLRTGHTLTFAASHMDIEVTAHCPHEGTQFDSIAAAPPCWVLDEDGMPGSGPYLADECAVVREVRKFGQEAIHLKDEPSVPIGGDPMPVDWHVEQWHPAAERELYVRPSS